MSKLPSFYSSFREAHPRVATAYQELGQVPLLAITTLGFPAAMAVRAMIEDVLGNAPA